MLDEQGCFDTDECITSDKYCPGNQFCVNKEGGYTCLSKLYKIYFLNIKLIFLFNLGCDKACNGCTGDGPDMCIKCAEGYHKSDNLCISKFYMYV